MTIVIIVLAIIILILIAILWHYQRQVKEICRQLAFLKDHDTNMLVTSDTDIGNLRELKQGINDVLSDTHSKQRTYLSKEKDIAETYTNLSHDIRTPLTSLDGYFQLLSEAKTEEDKQRYINIIKERIDSLNNLLEELFTFTKLKNDSYQLSLTRLQLNKLVKEIILSYYEDWVAQNMEPVLDITDTPLYVNANAQALHRVIQNIIKNVLEHGEKEIKITLQQDKQSAILTICNYVQNPDKIDVGRVFERFYKADAARSKISSGLGLSIAHSLVKKMNGGIHAEISGNTFQISVILSLI